MSRETLGSIHLPAVILMLLTASPTGTRSEGMASRQARVRREIREGTREIQRE